MTTLTAPTVEAIHTPEPFLTFNEKSCVRFCERNQNQDGGWGYRRGLPSATEPTASVVSALSAARTPTTQRLTNAGLEWLCRAQLCTGAWPNFMAYPPSCWATALASSALMSWRGASDPNVQQGIRWLLATWPAEGTLRRRLTQRWLGKTNVASQNSSLRGWSWMPDTASWVEPTAYALILLRNAPEHLRSAGYSKRIQLAERMLFDRMCPGGGWNSGNPLVYGVAGEPKVGPTVWALLALRNHQQHPGIQNSLAWLQRTHARTVGPLSISLSYLCLDAFGRAPSSLARSLQNYAHDDFLEDSLATAWATAALLGWRPGMYCGAGQ
jgi:hypothetical protein